MQGEALEVDHVQVGEVAGSDDTAIGPADVAGGALGLLVHDLFERLARSPRLRSRVQWVIAVVGNVPSQMELQWAPASDNPNIAFGDVSISRTSSRLPLA